MKAVFLDRDGVINEIVWRILYCEFGRDSPLSETKFLSHVSDNKRLFVMEAYYE